MKFLKDHRGMELHETVITTPIAIMVMLAIVNLGMLVYAQQIVQAATRQGARMGSVAQMHSEKTRIVHIREGFEFLGYKIKRGGRPLKLAESRIKSGAKTGGLYAYPRDKSVRHFKDQIRNLTRRRAPVTTQELITEINPIIRGWGLYFNKAHVRKLFNRLDRWIVRRIWSHRYKRWRCCDWKTLPENKLYGELGLVNLISLIPSLGKMLRGTPLRKPSAGNLHAGFERRTEASP